MMASSLSPRKCIVCDAEIAEPFMRIGNVPVECNVLWRSRDEAVAVPRGDMELVHCQSCGHVFNRAFDSSKLNYTQAYENSLHFSSRFQTYVEDLVARLINDYGLREQVVVDIGCGKGDFLALLCERGSNVGYGFDPSFVPEHFDGGGSPRFTIIRDLYSAKYSDYGGDMFTCRHVLEHVQDPAGFVRDIRQAVLHHPRALTFFEVPDALYTLKDLGIWDLIYEHCSYFTPPSLVRLCERTGFHVLRLEEMYGGQFLGVDLNSQGTGTFGLPGWQDEHRRLVAAFADRYHRKVETWRGRLEQFERSGRKAVIWGGGSKGVTFMNVLSPARPVVAVVDINPRKQGMFVSGTGLEIIGPERLNEFTPDVIVVMNALYRDEIAATVSRLGLKAEIVEA